MPKITEYPNATTFDANDVLLKDGTNGTKVITIENFIADVSNTASTTNGKLAKAGDLANLTSDFNQLKSEFEETQGYHDVDYTYTEGYFVRASTGLLSHGGNGNVTNFIDVTPYAKIRYAKLCVVDSSMNYGMCFYEEDQSTVVTGGEAGGTNAAQRGYEESIIAVPEGAKYARFTFWNETNLPELAGQFYIYGIYPEPAGFEFDYKWAAGYVKSDGTYDSRQQFNNYCSRLIHGFSTITFDPSSGKQVNISYFDKHTGTFISNSGWSTAKTTINNQYDVRINIGTVVSASSGGTVSLEDLIDAIDIEVNNYIEPRWNGAKAAFVGDSITSGVNTDSENIYYKLIDSLVGFSNVYADGIAGCTLSASSTSTYTPVTQRLGSIPTDMDLVVIFAGTNDWGYNTPIGTISDTTDVSFYGAMSVIINTIINANPDVRLVFITPLHRYGYTGGSYPNDTDQNGQSKTLKDYVDAMKAMAELYSIPLIDMFSVSGLNPRVTEIKDDYITDGLHPNAAGHNIIARRIVPLLETI